MLPVIMQVIHTNYNDKGPWCLHIILLAYFILYCCTIYTRFAYYLEEEVDHMSIHLYATLPLLVTHLCVLYAYHVYGRRLDYRWYMAPVLVRVDILLGSRGNRQVLVRIVGKWLQCGIVESVLGSHYNGRTGREVGQRVTQATRRGTKAII
jgi:hypothetical protein